MTLEQIEYTAIRVKDAGDLTGDYELLTTEEVGIGERTLVSGSVTTIRGRDAKNQFVELAQIKDPQTDSDTFNLDFFGHSDLVETLTQFKQQNKDFYVQLMSFPSPPVDVPSLATKVEHYLVTDTGMTLGAGRNRDGSGGLRENSIALAASKRVIANLGTTISNVTNALTEDALAITMISEEISRKTGFAGADKIIYVGLDDDAVNPGTVIVSKDGGSTWAALTTDPDPFTEVSGVNTLAWQFISETQFRLVASRTTDAGAKAMFAYGDFTFGAEEADPSWTVITIAATSNADAVEATIWPDANRLYVAAAGDIYLSTDLAISDPGAAIFTGSNAFAQFFRDSDRNVWGVAAANAIVVELVNGRGTFVTRVGPSGGGAFHSLARADNGVIYAGNGTSIFRNTDEARSTSGWTSLKDFGANHQVEKILCVKGSSEIVLAVVTDNTGNDGDIWYTTNGGVTWTEKTDVTNNGYNDAVISNLDPNLLFAVGPINTNPIIHKLS